MSMMNEGFDILHPLATPNWKLCGTLPGETNLVQCVSLGDRIYLCGKTSGYDTRIFMSSADDLKSWKIFVTPTHRCALTTYRSQLMLLGGVEGYTSKATNKVWTCAHGTGRIKWQLSSTPMLTSRYGSSAINTGNPECIVVAGGYGEDTLDVVEVLVKNQWWTVEPLPKASKFYDHALHNDQLYLTAGFDIYHCDIKSLIDYCSPHAQHSHSLWKEEQAPWNIVVRGLASFGHRLIAICDSKIFAYTLGPLGHLYPAIEVGNSPEGTISGSLALPNGDLVVTMCGFHSKVYRASVSVSPYNPDGRFSMKSLSRLQRAGIEIITSLTDNITLLASLLESEAGIFLDKDVSYYGLHIAITTWTNEGGRLPPTWKVLLDILKSMNLNELIAQMEYYLHGKQDYLDAYRKILATQECIEMWFIKIALLGAPRLGKTTVRRRLTGEIDDISSSGEGEQPSTGVLESGHSVVIRNLSSTTALVTPSEWLATKDLTDEARMFLQYFHSHISEKKAAQNTERIAQKSEDTEDNSMSANVAESGSSSSSNAFAEPLSVPEGRSGSQSEYMYNIPDMIRNAVSPKLWREITQSYKDTAFVKMEDTGGQPEFMDMLPALTIGPALYLLFCKLTDELQSCYKLSYLSSSGECTIARESTYTVQEMLLTALASITCFKSFASTLISSEEIISSTADQLITSCNKSAAYIIGTHKDLVSEEQICAFDEKLQQCIRPTTFFEDDIVQFSSEHRMVLPIDNMHGGSSEIQLIRKFLEKGLKEHFKKLSIPASWLVLSLCLRKREERTASLDSVLQLAGELGIPQEEAMVALWFLHHYAGVLMYFPNLSELKDTVICDNQIIYDSATNLIVNTFKFGSVGKAASERFTKTGQFSLEDIRRATTNISGDYIPLEKLVKLLEHLNILASFIKSISGSTPVPSCQRSRIVHFMPCVLRNATQEEMTKWWDSTYKQLPAPLFIRYRCGFVPIGVFTAMIANFAGNTSLEMIVENINKNRVEFFIGSDYDTVTFVSHPKYYAAHITRRKSAKTPIHEVCATVRGLMESTLKAVTSQMNYNFIAEYQLAFECPSHPGREHLCVVKQSDTSPHVMCCQGNIDRSCPVDMLDQHLVWFERVSTDTGPASSRTIPSLSSLNLLKWEDEYGQGQVFRLVSEVSAEWCDFGMLLGLKLNELKAWETQYRGDAKKCWNEVMEHWLNAGGSRDYPATWEGLYTLLNDLELGNIAKRLKRAVSARI